jgi:hypothetical protein
VVAVPALRWAIKAVGIGYLVWLAWKLSQSGQLGEADAARMDVGFWQGAAAAIREHQGLAAVADHRGGLDRGAPDSLQRLAVVLPVMAAVCAVQQFCVCLRGRAAAPLAGARPPPAVVQPCHGPCPGGDGGMDGARMSTPVSPSVANPGVPAPSTGPAPHPRATPEARGLALGLLGVTIFALTLPMTRLAVGTPEAPLMSGLFIAMGRAALAGLLSGALLLALRAPLPQRADAWPLVLTALGVVFGFPLLTSIAMRHVSAVHASVIVGVLPLATAAVGALLHRQRPSPAFWACAALGTGLVVGFAVLRSGAAGLALHPADLLLLGAMLCAAVGYGFGARLSQHMRAEFVICWALVISLPVTAPLAAAVVA